MERQQDGYIIPPAALQKLRTARTAAQTVYIYGATGFGKTELLRHYQGFATPDFGAVQPPGYMASAGQP